jgi:K+:H+ antiporter
VNLHLAGQIDPALSPLVALALAALVLGLVMRLLRQPSVIAYLVAGIVLGPHALRVVTEPGALEGVGNAGVVLLLFFVGMEVSLPKLVASWKVALLGTGLQIAGSLLFIAPLAWWLEWPLPRAILLGFVISLSSTAVVIKLLQEWKELETPIGQDVVAVLLAQDLAIVPMLVILAALGGEEVETNEVLLQAVAGVGFLVFLGYLVVRTEVHLPLPRVIREDPELQVFAALIICFGLALISGALGLSTALGAFAAGVLVSTARETHWVHERLNSFRIVTVAAFFVSVGSLLDLSFVWANVGVLGLLLVGVVLTNTLINAVILRLLGRPWAQGLYGGALLSQAGEFSFVLAAVGLQGGIVEEFAYQATMATIALSLALSPLWILLIKKLTGVRHDDLLDPPTPAPAAPPAGGHP